MAVSFFSSSCNHHENNIQRRCQLSPSPLHPNGQRSRLLAAATFLQQIEAIEIIDVALCEKRRQLRYQLAIYLHQERNHIPSNQSRTLQRDPNYWQREPDINVTRSFVEFLELRQKLLVLYPGACPVALRRFLRLHLELHPGVLTLLVTANVRRRLLQTFLWRVISLARENDPSDPVRRPRFPSKVDVTAPALVLLLSKFLHAS